jgi:hypothetical protein
VSTRPSSSSGRESPNESICTTDSGVNSDLDLGSILQTSVSAENFLR